MKLEFIDVHQYFGRWGFPIKEVSIPDTLKEMESMNIKKAIIISSKSILYDMKAGNELVYKAVTENECLFGYVYINGNYPGESLSQMERYFTGEKFVGVKFHPEYSKYTPDSPECEAFWDALENVYHKPALIHCWTLPEHDNEICYSHPRYCKNIAKRHPGLKLVLGHMGGVGWQECLETVAGCSNIYVDYCCSYPDRDKIKVAVEMLGADRVLFGTAMFENNGWMQIGSLEESDLPQEIKRKIAWENAARVFGI